MNPGIQQEISCNHIETKIKVAYVGFDILTIFAHTD